MIWETSPAAAELEEKVMNWLKEMTGLTIIISKGSFRILPPRHTLAAILTAREKATGFRFNEEGFATDKNSCRVYCSEQTHSSVEKGSEECRTRKKEPGEGDVRDDFQWIRRPLKKPLTMI
ncbi:MAG: pyridoxal-dependent decarboxylase [Marinilabiliales bacterium]|nr:pyridoxal-dependent decarboxylase [Marinilabiliales bacterium]